MPIRPSIPLPGPLVYVPGDRDNGGLLGLFVGLPVFLVGLMLFSVVIAACIGLLICWLISKMIWSAITRTSRKQDPVPVSTDQTR